MSEVTRLIEMQVGHSRIDEARGAYETGSLFPYYGQDWLVYDFRSYESCTRCLLIAAERIERLPGP